VEERPRYEREERRPHAEAAAPDVSEPAEAETAVAEPGAEGYAEPTQSEESEASEPTPEEEA
jgi:hypothetical protein